MMPTTSRCARIGSLQVSAQRLVIPEIEQRDNEEPAGLFAIGSVMPTGGGPDLEHQNPVHPRCRHSMLSMAVHVSRYDPITDWYVDFTRAWGTESRAFLPDDLFERRVLDMACGHGELSRHLATRGASITAVDLSVNMLTHATNLESTQGLGIRYVHGDVTTTGWWDGDCFDGVVCNMALMDIDDLDAALETAAVVLRPGGWFSFSLLHPCFPGFRDGESEQLSSWPPDRGYAWEGWWTTDSDGVRGRVGANHWMLSTYLNAAVRAGFDLEEFAEPAFPVPRYLIARCRRRW